jgi:hypothetical protein
MKLIREYTDWQDLEVLTESNERKGMSYKIKGPFIQSEVKNRNGRIYPKTILEREVNRYNTEKINKHNAMGELDHPPSPSVNLDRVSHLVESLIMEGNNGMGVARILPTPTGKIAESLLESGVQLGVSSRGVGSLTNDKVNGDYRLLAIDIVADPSAPSAYVDGVLEGVEWECINESHYRKVEIIKESVVGLTSKERLAIVESFFKEIKKKK